MLRVAQNRKGLEKATSSLYRREMVWRCADSLSAGTVGVLVSSHCMAFAEDVRLCLGKLEEFLRS